MALGDTDATSILAALTGVTPWVDGVPQTPARVWELEGLAYTYNRATGRATLTSSGALPSIADSRALLNNSGGTAVPIATTKADFRAWLNVADGATNDTTAIAALATRITAVEPIYRELTVNFASAQAYATMQIGGAGTAITQAASTATLYEMVLTVDHGTLDAAEDILPANATRVIHFVAWRNLLSACAFVYDADEDDAPWNVADVEFQLVDVSGDFAPQARKDTASTYTGSATARAYLRARSTIPWTADTSPTLEMFGGAGGAVTFASMAAAVATAGGGVAWEVNGDDGGLWGVVATGHVQLTAGEIAITGSSIAIGTTAGNGVTVGNTTGSTYLIGATCNLGTGAGNVTTAGNTTGVTEVTGSTTRIKSAGDVVLRPTGHSTDACAWQVASGYARWYAGSSGITGLALASPSNATYCLIDNGQFFVSAGGTGINLVGAGSVQLVSTASSATLGALGVASIDNGSGVFVRRYGVGVERIGIRTPADVGTASTARVVLATIPIPTGAMRRLRASVKGWPAGAAGGAWTVDVHVENVGGSLTKYAETIALVTGTQNLGTVDVTINGTNIEIGVTPAAASSRTWHANDMGDV
jgi:hypothetical protein